MSLPTTELDLADDDDELPTTGRPDEDLGFGRVVAQQARGRFLSHDGIPQARKYGLGAQRAARFYLRALNANWVQFLGWLFGSLLLLNGAFALLYLAIGPNSIAGVDGLQLDDPFLRALVFSIGIFTTTGTSAMHAVGSTANWLVILESLVGPLSLVAASGLLIARLTRPRVRIRYTDSMIVAPYEGGRGLMFRIVNMQPGELSDLKVRVNVSRFEMVNGKRERNFHRLELEIDQVEFFTLHWTIVHPITASSPLAGVTPESLRESEAEFLIHIAAHEETFSTRVISRASYRYDEVQWDVKWASMFTTAPDDDVIAIDVERLDRMDRLDEGVTRVPAAIERA